MSKRKQENVSDIVAEMRDTCHNSTLGIKTDREKRLEKFLKDIMIEYADRIEAAAKREREAGAEAAQICGEIGEIIGSEATREKSSAVGNAAAKHQFREVAKMIPHEEMTVAEIQQPLQPVADCHGLNAAKMRDALVEVYNTLEQLNPYALHINDISTRREFISRLCHAKNVIDFTLSAPPRNCDLLSDAQEALAAIHEDRCYVNNPIDERRLTVEWLFSEAKGETDGSK